MGLKAETPTYPKIYEAGEISTVVPKLLRLSDFEPTQSDLSNFNFIGCTNLSDNTIILELSNGTKIYVPSMAEKFLSDEEFTTVQILSETATNTDRVTLYLGYKHTTNLLLKELLKKLGGI